MRQSPVSAPSPRRTLARQRWLASQHAQEIRESFTANQNGLAVQRVAQASGLL